MRVLIVEDDPLLGAGLQIGLGQDGYVAEWLQSADPAEHALRVEHFDVMVLDLGLPGRDGLKLLRDLRQQGIDLPVLILTARDAIADKVAGLDAGADDYLVKPFDLDELNARIRALLRRFANPPNPAVSKGGFGSPFDKGGGGDFSKRCLRTGHATALFQAGELAVDTARHTVTLGEQLIALSPKEYSLLEALIAHADCVVPRSRLQATTYGWHDDIESNALEVHIHHLRHKLGKQRILTVRGVGYQLLSQPAP
ncbi:DNA-binding response regulator [Chromatium okenii]|uniref:response regulator n=1 Tax=Chromatium okenii TaxID=61644 RepID=UPI001904497F|nr:response regulator [Chromatium okenii]MBK1641472.1 DNA-binding response regulator [Chromatium okenii]